VIRVVQWGTGHVGTHALRTVLGRPDLELVGVKVYDPAKVGIDAGQLGGLPPTGIRCTTDENEIFRLGADCVNFSALASTEDAFDATIEVLCRLLKSGANVTSSALEHLVQPTIVPEAFAALEEACREGGTSFYDTGINPGYAMDLWPITLSRLSRTIERISVTEVVDMVRYDSPMVRPFMGFGLPPGDRPIDDMHRNTARSPFYASILQVADAMDVRLDAVRYRRDTAVTEVSVETASGTLDPGSVAAMRMEVVGIAGGESRFANSWVWRMSDEVAPEWPLGDRWELEIVGDPSVRSVLELSTNSGAGRPVSLTVATLNVNAIPTLCRVAPGVYTNLTLPNFAGGYIP
jgi:2,4-diaminopentanoate dehydrogenase